MVLAQEQIEQLHQPLDMSVIKHRPGGGGKQLKYIKGDRAIDTANRIFGFGQWGYKVVARSHEVIEDDKKGRIEFYTADVELSVVGAAFPFPGDGIGIVTAPFTVEMHEKARKEATTDALKRALRHYGDQFGLCLYDEDDYVDAGNGTLVQVRDVTPNKQVQQPRRIVESQPQSPQLLAPQTHQNGHSVERIAAHQSSQKNAVVPVQRETEASQPDLKAHVTAVYRRAGKLNLFEAVPNDPAATQANFYKLVSELVEATITASGQITASRLEIVEAYVNGKDAPQAA